MGILKPKSKEEIDRLIEERIENCVYYADYNEILIICCRHNHTEGILKAFYNGVSSDLYAHALMCGFYYKNLEVIELFKTYFDHTRVEQLKLSAESRKKGRVSLYEYPVMM